jgi:hypothetical protein
MPRQPSCHLRQVFKAKKSGWDIYEPQKNQLIDYHDRIDVDSECIHDIECIKEPLDAVTVNSLRLTTHWSCRGARTI